MDVARARYLAMPADLAERWVQWAQVAANSYFFDTVAECVRSQDLGSIQSASSSLEGWAAWCQWLRDSSTGIEARYRTEFEILYAQVVRAQALALAAKWAIQKPDVFKGGQQGHEWLTSVQPSWEARESGLAGFLGSEMNQWWMWVAARTLLHVPCQSVEEPVAFWNEKVAVGRLGAREEGEAEGADTTGGGTLAKLELEVLPRGVGRFAQHPMDLFAQSRYKSDFEQSLQRAWEAARLLCKERDSQHYALHDARWRLVDQPKSLLVSGDSASGAAARGFFLALTNRVEDESLVVFAAVDASEIRRLTGVGAVRAKTRAIAATGRFDTIVVASREDAAEARAALPASSQIHVEDLSSMGLEPAKRSPSAP